MQQVWSAWTLEALLKCNPAADGKCPILLLCLLSHWRRDMLQQTFNEQLLFWPRVLRSLVDHSQQSKLTSGHLCPARLPF